LNGLKAIAVPRPLPDVLKVKRETERPRLAQALSAQPSVTKEEPETGLDCSGISIAAPDIRL
jgi:hypothetical protein